MNVLAIQGEGCVLLTTDSSVPPLNAVVIDNMLASTELTSRSVGVRERS